MDTGGVYHADAPFSSLPPPSSSFHGAGPGAQLRALVTYPRAEAREATQPREREHERDPGQWERKHDAEKTVLPYFFYLFIYF